jgi:hypothetical protein
MTWRLAWSRTTATTLTSGYWARQPRADGGCADCVRLCDQAFVQQCIGCAFPVRETLISIRRLYRGCSGAARDKSRKIARGRLLFVCAHHNEYGPQAKHARPLSPGDLRPEATLNESKGRCHVEGRGRFADGAPSCCGGGGWGGAGCCAAPGRPGSVLTPTCMDPSHPRSDILGTASHLLLHGARAHAPSCSPW